MDWQSAFNLAIGIVGLLGGWILKTLWEAIQDLRKDLQSIPETYVRRDSFTEFRRELFVRLDRIEGKIDRKVDR